MNDLAKMEDIAAKAFGKLPSYLDEPFVEVQHLKDGEFGWIDHPTVLFDREGQGWLKHNGEVYPNNNRYHERMRVGKKDDIYVLDITNWERKIKREDRSFYPSFSVMIGLITSREGLT